MERMEVGTLVGGKVPVHVIAQGGPDTGDLILIHDNGGSMGNRQEWSAENRATRVSEDICSALPYSNRLR